MGYNEIITKGRELGFSDNVIEDLLYISCRVVKLIKASDLIQQIDNYVNVVLKRGYPYKFNSKAKFDKFKGELKKGLGDIGISTADLRIQGSSLRTTSAKDVDIAVMVDENLFIRLLRDRFNNRITKNGKKIDIADLSMLDINELIMDIRLTPVSYNAQAKTFEHAFSSGKLRPQDIDGLNSLKNTLKNNYGDLDISIIKKVSNFDIKPYLELK